MRIPIPAIVIPVVVVLLYFFVPGVRELPWTPLRIAGATVALAAFALVCVARIQLGDSFSVRPRAKGLVTSGLYSRLRHPIYVFVDLMVVGVILVLQVYWAFTVIPVLVAGQTIQARREGSVLRRAYGPAYDDYRRRTWF